MTAAIIVGKQLPQNGVTEIEIITDSQYMKNSITKWIHDWKMNDWKIVRKKTEILNRDLWMQLDEIVQKINIDWSWIETYKNVFGSCEAERLSKEGISCECNRQKLMTVNIENPMSKAETTNDQTHVKELDREDTVSHEDRSDMENCKICRKVTDKGIECMDCKRSVHYLCTKLPPYQLFLYETTNRKFMCELCSEMDQDFNTRWKSLHNSIPSQTNISRGTQIEKSKYKSEKSIHTQTAILKSCKQQTTPQEDSKANTAADSNQAVLQTMENSFIETTDKIVKAQHKMDENDKKINNLIAENDSLKKKLESCEEQKRECDKCKEKEREINSYVKEKKKLGWRSKVRTWKTEKKNMN